uniref:RING-H2 finger protein ATL7-like isoform X3 n=1 Tax=Rhizophora mucronata TaxID=61149 RepID=A0A2P2J749_RHIMU
MISSNRYLLVGIHITWTVLTTG